MINIIFLSIVASTLFTPIGFLFNKNQLNKSNSFEDFSKSLVYSIIILSFLALLINFFSPLDKIINSLILLIPILVIFFNRKIFFETNFFLFSFFVSIIVLLLITKSNTYRPDAGLYHLPYISILNDEKIIFGLANLHFRFGHVSIIQYTSGIFNNFIFSSNGIIFPSALIYSAILINFCSQILSYLKKKNYNIHLFFLILTIIFIAGKMGRYSEFGNDVPAHILFLFLISEVLKNISKNNTEEIKNFFLISIFIILNKIFLIMSIFIPFLFVSKKNYKEIFFSKKAIFGTSFILLWALKTTIISGCAIYPVKATCLKNVAWIDIEKIEIISNENEAWAKSWVNHKNEINHKEYIKKFRWVSTWLINNGFKTFKIVFPYLIISSLIAFLLLRNNKNKNKIPKNDFLILKRILIILLVGILIWLLKAPDFRYGLGYMIGLISLCISIFISKIKIKTNINKLVLLILIISFSIFALKNSKRIVLANNDYFNYPWPKYYSHDNKNEYKKPKKIVLNGKEIYKANGLCMYGFSPCSNQKINFFIFDKFSYYFFIKKSDK